MAQLTRRRRGLTKQKRFSALAGERRMRPLADPIFISRFQFMKILRCYFRMSCQISHTLTDRFH